MGCYSTFVWFSLLPAVRLAWGAVNQTVGRGSREKCRLLAGTNCSFCLTIVRLRHTHTHWHSKQVIGDKLDKMDPSTFEPRACELLHGLGFTKQMMQKARERTARAAKYWYYLLHCFLSVRVRMICCADRDALCTMHLKVPHTHIYILYIIIYLSGRHHGLMDFAPATQWPWHFWKNAIATLATQMHHAQRRFKDTDSNFEILWEVLSQLWGHEGHVWWLAYACCTRSSLVCRAYASASWWVQLSSAQSSFALRKMYSLRLFPTVFS